MFVKKVLDGVALVAGAATDVNITKIDCDSLGNTAEFIVSAKAVGNTVAISGTRTITVSYAFSDEDIAPVAADLQAGGKLFQRRVDASSGQIITLLTGASKTTYWEVFSTPIRPKARFLYMWITKTTEDAGAITTLTLQLVKLRSTTSKF